MVGQWTATKPSRSDEVLDEDQQLMITNQIRSQFESLAPKRPTKPNRSEPDQSPASNPSKDVCTADQSIPELDRLRSLRSQSHVIYSGEGATVQDEFVETEYYKELVSIDKQHHTTGSGFIKIMKEGSEENVYDIQLGSGHGGRDRPTFKSNPATNDWIPTTLEDDHQI
ncbi:hypothetical protein ACOSP7_023229 [Xanthoceras sorbifolium]|uniref:Maternal effect embryo arrest 59 n=1 Tax=Xanthoceras sorbifolium TaxID=99658 RepID=A0ABQ8HQL5_9ROSI|nr:hypothetical protein JRO89_XS08G0207700 [Xanthoceras sorbifolium]